MPQTRIIAERRLSATTRLSPEDRPSGAGSIRSRFHPEPPTDRSEWQMCQDRVVQSDTEAGTKPFYAAHKLSCLWVLHFSLLHAGSVISAVSVFKRELEDSSNLSQPLWVIIPKLFNQQSLLVALWGWAAVHMWKHWESFKHPAMHQHLNDNRNEVN